MQPLTDVGQEGRDNEAADSVGVSLVLPVHNQAATVAQVIQDALDGLAAISIRFEIIVVDDGSSDGTAEAVRAVQAGKSHVRLLQHPTHRGHGAAVCTGLEAARYELVALTDTSRPFDNLELGDLLSLASRYDVACSYRVDRRDPAMQRWLSRIYNALARALLVIQVREVDCPLKVFRRDALPAILPESHGLFANAEMLAKARLAGRSIVEVGVRDRRLSAAPGLPRWDTAHQLAALFPFWWSRLLFAGADAPVGGAGRGLWAGLVLVAMIAGFLLFPNLSYPLVEPDEGRYAEIGREMLVSGDWVLPRLNQTAYLDKPPMLYWLEAGGFRLFGVNERAARLVPALAAFLTVLATYLLGRQLVGTGAGLFGALALVSMIGFTQCGRFLVVDGVLTLFVTLASFAGCIAVQKTSVRWSWWLISAACCALGVLTKGPISLVLVIPPLAAHVWLTASRGRPTLTHWSAFLAVVFTVAAPWYFLVTLRDPSFARYFFIEHHLNRFFGSEFHDSPFWYYVPVLAVGALPWSLLLAALFARLFRPAEAKRVPLPASLGYFVLWSAWCILFFSVSNGKLAPYIIPATPALAVLVGSSLDSFVRRSWQPFSEWWARVLPAASATALAVAWLVASTGAWRLHLVGPAFLAVQAGLCLGIVTIFVIWGWRIPVPAAWLLCAVFAAITVAELTQKLVPTWAERRSPLARAPEVVRLVRDEDVPVACFGGDWGSVPFYAGSRASVVSFSEFGIREVRDYLQEHPRCLFVIKHRQHVGAFRKALPPSAEMSTLVDVGEARAVLVNVEGVDLSQGPTTNTTNVPGS